MQAVDWNPDPRKLRQFGWTALAGFFLLGCLLGWRLGSFSESGSMTVPWVFWGLAVVVWLAGLVAPVSLRPVYVLLMVLTWPIGFVVSNLALAVVFVGLILPLSLWFRLIGRDELQRDWDAEDSQFWKPSRPARDLASYYRPF